MNKNPYAPPTAPVADPVPSRSVEFEYAGFWIRAGASMIDGILIVVVTFPLLYVVYGSSIFLDESRSIIRGPADFLISYVAPAVATVFFWRIKQGTPGKLLLSLRIVDATSRETLSVGRCVARYLGYIPASLILGLGVLWVAFDDRKQGWHDKMAKSVVIRVR